MLIGILNIPKRIIEATHVNEIVDLLQILNRIKNNLGPFTRSGNLIPRFPPKPPKKNCFIILTLKFTINIEKDPSFLSQ